MRGTAIVGGLSSGHENADWQKGVEKFIGKPAKLAATSGGSSGTRQTPVEQLKRIYAKVQGFRNLSYREGPDPGAEERAEDQGQPPGRRRPRAGLRPPRRGRHPDLLSSRAADGRPDLRPRSFASRPGTISSFARIISPFMTSWIPRRPSSRSAKRTCIRSGDAVLSLRPRPLERDEFDGAACFPYATGLLGHAMQPPEMALTQREAALDLDLRAAWPVKTTLRGQEALVRRLEYLHDDSAARSGAALRERAHRCPPHGRVGNLTKVENFKDNDPALIATMVFPFQVRRRPAKVIMPASPLSARASGAEPSASAPSTSHIPSQEFWSNIVVVTCPRA